MPDPHKRTLELVLPAEAVGETLARLTAEAPHGRLVLGEQTLSLDRWARIKVRCKRLGDSCQLTVRVKTAEPGETSGGVPAAPLDAGPASGGRERYKDLKKRMKETFKMLRTSLAAGQPPHPDILAAFVADSRRMTAYPGKGDAFYPAYAAEVSRLEAAAAAGDLSAMTSSAAELARMKKECHSRHA